VKHAKSVQKSAATPPTGYIVLLPL